MFLFSWGQSMAWKAYSPWQREFNSHQKSTLFHENGRFFLPAHLNPYFSNSLAYLNSSSPALAPVPATEQTLTCPLLETHWGQHRLLGLTSTEATLHFRCLPLQSGVAHPSICYRSKGLPQMKPDSCFCFCILDFPPDADCLEHSHLHLRTLQVSSFQFHAAMNFL